MNELMRKIDNFDVFHNGPFNNMYHLYLNFYFYLEVTIKTEQEIDKKSEYFIENN